MEQIKIKKGFVGVNHIWKSDEFKYLEIDKDKKIKKSIFKVPVFNYDSKVLINCTHFSEYKFSLDNKNTKIYKITNNNLIDLIEKARKTIKESYPYNHNYIVQPYFYEDNKILIQDYHELWLDDNEDEIENTLYQAVIISLILDLDKKEFKLILQDDYDLEEYLNEEVRTFYEDMEDTKNELKKLNKTVISKLNDELKSINLDINKDFEYINDWLIVTSPNEDKKIFKLKYEKEADGYVPFGFNDSGDLLRSLLWYGKKHLKVDPKECSFKLSKSFSDMKFEDIMLYYNAIPIKGIIRYN